MQRIEKKEKPLSNQPCQKCQELLNKRTNIRHSDLERDGVSKSVGFHGRRDDEYLYRCKVCGTRFIGDNMGTWPEKE